MVVCDALHDLVIFAQFKKRVKHPWKSVNFSKVAGFSLQLYLKLTLLHGCFSRFLNCTNITKSRNASHIPLTAKSLFQLSNVPSEIIRSIWICSKFHSAYRVLKSFTSTAYRKKI